MMTLTEIEEALSKITQGKWSVSSPLCCPDYGWVDPIIDKRSGQMCHCLKIYDAEFIAASPDYIRFLINEVKRLQDENRGLQNTIAQMQDAEDKVYRCRLASGAKYTETLEIVKQDGVREGRRQGFKEAAEFVKNVKFDGYENIGLNVLYAKPVVEITLPVLSMAILKKAEEI